MKWEWSILFVFVTCTVNPDVFQEFMISSGSTFMFSCGAGSMRKNSENGAV
jgi:hypothetical protein